MKLASLLTRKPAAAPAPAPEPTYLARLLAKPNAVVRDIGPMTQAVTFIAPWAMDDEPEWIIRYDDDGVTTIERPCGCVLDARTGATLYDCED